LPAEGSRLKSFRKLRLRLLRTIDQPCDSPYVRCTRFSSAPETNLSACGVVWQTQLLFTVSLLNTIKYIIAPKFKRVSARSEGFRLGTLAPPRLSATLPLVRG
jgi:hypothetical protein